MKSEQRDHSTLEIYKPNHPLYRALLAASAFITLIGALFSSCTAVSSVLLGIGSGGIASVVVAWLIDISTCKQNNKKAELTRKNVFSQICSAIESSIQLFALQCFHLGVIKDFDDQKTWLDWVKDTCTAAKSNPEELGLFCKQSCVFADNLMDQVSTIDAQTVLLFDLGIVGADEKSSITTIMNTCDTFRSEYRINGVSLKLADDYLRNFKVLHAVFENMPVVREFNNKKLAATLFQRFDKDELKQILQSKEDEV